MIHRLSIANLEPAELAERLAAEGLDGTALPATGFTAEWGLEPTALAILAGADLADILAAARSILAETGEAAAYLDDGDQAWLIWADRLEAVA